MEPIGPRPVPAITPRHRAPEAPQDKFTASRAERIVDTVIEGEGMVMGVRAAARIAMDIGLTAGLGLAVGPVGLAVGTGLAVAGALGGHFITRFNTASVSKWGNEIGDRHLGGNHADGRMIAKMGWLVGQTLYLITGEPTSSVFTGLIFGSTLLGAQKTINFFKH